MDWVKELRESLQRAGDHISEEHETLHLEARDGSGDIFVFRLWHQLPTDAKSHVSAYIRGFAEEHGWKVKNVRHRKFSIEIKVAPLYV
jgi:hypothetical protein